MFNRAVSAFRKGIVARKAAQVENTDHDRDNDGMGADDTAGMQSAALSPSALLPLVDSKGKVSVTSASAAS